MKRRPLVAGAAVVAIYLLGVFVSGRLDILARRPLLEGNFIPPPYRWVSPPPDLAGNNLKPDSKQQTVKFEGGASAGEFVATEDGQASVVLPKGAIKSKPGSTAVAFSIEPHDPAAFRGYPKGKVVRGNVYEIRATYVGGAGGPIGPTDPPARIILTYPAHTPEFAGATHEVVQSPDGENWKTLLTDNDSPVALQIAISSTELGLFAVAAKPGKMTTPGRGTAPFVIISAVVAVAGLAGTYSWRMARIRTANKKKRVARQLPKNKRRR